VTIKLTCMVLVDVRAGNNLEKWIFPFINPFGLYFIGGFHAT